MTKVINMLLVEDDNLDVIDVKRTFDKMGILYKMKIARNGEEAIALLEDDNTEPFHGRPDVLIVDLNMPRMNGLEFIQLIRRREEWKDLKVFMLTTSEESEDKRAARALGISGYIIKPLKLNSSRTLDGFNLMIDLMNMQN